MNSIARALATCAAVGLAVPLTAAPAHAETVAETATVGAYYLATNPGVIGGQKAPDNAKSFDNVAQDDLAVAVVLAGSNQPDKSSALLWDLVDLTSGAQVTKATVVIPFSTKPDSRSTSKDPANVVACLAGPEGFGDADGEPMGDAPSAEACKEDGNPPPVTGTAVDGGTALEFDITAIAQTWTESNSGLLLYPSKVGFSRAFQTVFADKSAARLTVAFVPAPEEELLVEEPELEVTLDDVAAGTTETPVLDSETPSDAGTSLDTGTTPSFDAGAGFDAGTGTAALDAGTALPLDAPLAAEEPAVAAVAAAAPAPQAISRAGSILSPMSFDAVTWISLVVGAGLLTVVSLALGAPATPVGSGPPARLGGVASALAARRPGSFAGLSRP